LLQELKVRDLGIIENTLWQLGSGLNAITGETGAGKSLVIDALEILLGKKAGNEAVRHNSPEATIEGIFFVSDSIEPTIVSLLSEKGIELEDEALIISRSIHAQGRSVFRINGQAVSRNIVHTIGSLLIDIHGQSDHLALLETSYHLDLLDRYGGHWDLKSAFKEKLEQLRQIETEIDAMIREENDRAQHEDYLTYQIDEIRKANLHEIDEFELEHQAHILTSVEKLKSLAYGVYENISGEDRLNGSITDQLHSSNRDLKELSELDPELAQHANDFQSAVYNIEEVIREIRAYADRLESDPQKLGEIESQLESIRNLKRKYGNSIESILSFLSEAEEKLERISCSSERRTELEALRDQLKREMGSIASDLSECRRSAADRLIASVSGELAELDMSQVRFEVSFSTAEGENTIPLPSGQTSVFNGDGIDFVEYMVSTNPGEPIKPLNKVASTGEISRFMLALKSAFSAAYDVPVVVFDEIDIGIGGRSGDTIGRKLWTLSRDRQVICITHLPQIAVFADSHFRVHKEYVDGRTTSILTKLEEDSRIQELSAMLSGPQFLETAETGIHEMVDATRKWKRNSD